MNILLTNDWHLTHVAPGSRIDNFRATIDRKLDQMERIGLAEGVSAVAIAGDLCHVPTLSSGMLESVVSRLYRWKTAYHWPVLTVAGNHDEPHHNPKFLPDSSYGVLDAARLIIPVAKRVHVLTADSGPAVWVTGVDYPVTDVDLQDAAHIATEVLDTLESLRPAHGLVLIHAFGDLLGHQFFNEPVYAYDKIGRVFPEGRVFLFGHDHSDKGIVTLGEQHFVQVGSLLRGTLSDDQIDRQPVVVIARFLSSGVSCEIIPLEIEPPAVVFDLARKVKVETASDHIAAYVEQLGALTEASEDTPVSRVDGFAALLAPEIKARALAYLAQAEAQP